MPPSSFAVDPVSLQRPLPLGCRPQDQHLFAPALSETIAAVHGRSLQGAKVFADATVAGRGGLFPHWVHGGCPKGPKFHARRWLRHLGQRCRWGPRSQLSRALLISDWDSFNFFHWATDVLSKVDELAYQGWDLAATPIILPRDQHTPFAQTTLAAYAAQVHVLQPGERLRVDELQLIPPLAIPGTVRPAIAKRIRERIRSEIVAAKDGPRRLFISRRKAAQRRIVNEAELLPLLKDQGITPLCMEDYSFPEQVALCANAELIVGLHGAGLTHMLWMQPQGKVLEIRARGDSHNNCYFSLASALDLGYGYALAEPQGSGPTQSADFYLDPASLVF